MVEFGRVNPLLAYIVGILIGLQIVGVGWNVAVAAAVFGFFVIVVGELQRY